MWIVLFSFSGYLPARIDPWSGGSCGGITLWSEIIFQGERCLEIEEAN